MTVDQVLSDLRGRYGGRMVLYSEDLALLLGQSEEALASLVNCHGLPFGVKMLGNRRCVDIYQIAEWFAHSGAVTVQEATAVLPDTSVTPPQAPEQSIGQALPAVPGRSKIGTEILRQRHKNAGLLSTFRLQYFGQTERLFILEVMEELLFPSRLPPSQFVLTQSTSDPAIGEGMVSETRLLFESHEQAMKRALEIWMGLYGAAGAIRLVLRQGRRVLFRGLAGRFGREILVDLIGRAEATNVDG